MLRRGWSQECPNLSVRKNLVVHIFFECALYGTLRLIF